MNAFRSDSSTEPEGLPNLVLEAVRELEPASVPRIAGHLDYSQPAVQEALHELESLRLLTWTWQTRPGKPPRRIYSIATTAEGSGAA